MSPSQPIDDSESSEVKLLLRYAAQELTDKQRYAIEAYMYGYDPTEAGLKIGLSRQAIYQFRKSGLRKMRRRLEELRIKSSSDLLTQSREFSRPCRPRHVAHK